jgi:hypothetical protein
MGAILLASEERERSRLDVEFEGSASSTTSTSSDSDEEACPSVFGAMPTSRGLQGSVEVTSGFSKRTYGMNLAYEPTSSVERMLKCARLDEQLDGLRALLPHSARVSSKWACNSISFLSEHRTSCPCSDYIDDHACIELWWYFLFVISGW